MPEVDSAVDAVMAAVDAALRLPWLDPERLGIGGWSYGGILTNYTIASDSRFKGAVDTLVRDIRGSARLPGLRRR